MTREEANMKIEILSSAEINQHLSWYAIDEIFDDFEQQIQKLQEENERLKNMLQAHTKDK